MGTNIGKYWQYIMRRCLPLRQAKILVKAAQHVSSDSNPLFSIPIGSDESAVSYVVGRHLRNILVWQAVTRFSDDVGRRCRMTSVADVDEYFECA